ncbi:hypothetical protein CRT60_01140 [Azospirillum palustre]|uniref:Uncharacterized protein n=2 Tax=Azospirillum palustre TaxID=2044885 RepID=A0A2B8BPW1_9PROT|nr:hypothetical protein CRT60_01140 [Azospirillum palustre]
MMVAFCGRKLLEVTRTMQRLDANNLQHTLDEMVKDPRECLWFEGEMHACGEGIDKVFPLRAVLHLHPVMAHQPLHQVCARIGAVIKAMDPFLQREIRRSANTASHCPPFRLGSQDAVLFSHDKGQVMCFGVWSDEEIVLSFLLGVTWRDVDEVLLLINGGILPENSFGADLREQLHALKPSSNSAIMLGQLH